MKKITEIKLPVFNFNSWRLLRQTALAFGIAATILNIPTTVVAPTVPHEPVKQKIEGVATAIPLKIQSHINHINLAETVMLAESRGENPTSQKLDASLALKDRIDIGKMQVRWEAAVDVFKQIGSYG